MKFIKRVIDSPLAPLYLASTLILFVMIYLYIAIPTATNTLPLNITPSYKVVENTGLLGSARYYIFDTNGNRYFVTQDTFDSYVDLPRK